METQLPKSLEGRFEVLEDLGETPFERCFRAHDKVLQRHVMLKLPGRGAVEGWSAPVCNRMLREARTVAKIRHEGISPILWVEETAEGPLLVLDLPEGELLAERLQRGPLDVAETVDIGKQMAEALAQVHMQGVVHRAVGPSSVRVLANGRVRLGSFTFAKEFAEHGQPSSLASLRRAEAPVARYLPDYSAPEQIARQSADPRADIFALGCTLFRCLAGREAFEPGHEHEPMPDLRKLRRDVPKALAEVVRKCTLHAKTARYSTAQEVVDALKAVKAGLDKPAPSRWRFAVFASAGAVAVLSLAVLAAAVWPKEDLREGPPTAGSGPVLPTKTFLPTYEKVHGLMVAIGSGYAGKAFGALRNPTSEIEAVAARLRANDPQWRRPGAITRLRDHEATYERIDAELEKIVEQAGEDDAVLFYFAGHGCSDDYEFGLVTVDVGGPDIQKDRGYLRRSRLQKFLGDCRAKHVLVVLDCCHAGAVFPEARGAGRPTKDAQRAPGTQHQQFWSREFLCSAGADEKARDGQSLSPFCRALLDQLDAEAAAGSEFVAAKYLGALIGKRMEQRGGGQWLLEQVPQLVRPRDQKGSFVFRLKPATAK